MSNTVLAHCLRENAENPSIALTINDQTWTWEQYIRECSRRANWLLSIHDHTKPFHVGIFMENSPEFVFMLGACALSGATIVGLNLTRRGADIGRDISHSDCEIVVIESAQEPLLESAGSLPPVFVVDRGEESRLSNMPDSLPNVEVEPESLFALVFTSGTTSAPKAVRISQGKFYERITWIVEVTEMDASDIVYTSMPLFHANALVLGWAPTVMTGAQIVIRNRFSARGFISDILKYGVTYSHYIGKALSYVLEVPRREEEKENKLRLLYGNEASEKVMKEVEERLDCTIIDGFGTTEGGIGFTRNTSTPPGSIGLSRGDVRVLDPDTSEEKERAKFDNGGVLLNADSAVGELVNVGGIGRFEGYYKNEEAMLERVRLGAYWSGDLGYRDELGFFYHAGRTGDWVRVDGENLAIGPIERVMQHYPGFIEATIYGVPDCAAGEQIMLAVVISGDQIFDPNDFSQWLKQQSNVGPKWWPTYLRICDELPQTATNKVIKRPLQEAGWRTEDPVFLRNNRSQEFQIMDESAEQTIKSQFERFGRSQLIPGLNKP